MFAYIYFNMKFIEHKLHFITNDNMKVRIIEVRMSTLANKLNYDIEINVSIVVEHGRDNVN